jgi:hypothetical protein
MADKFHIPKNITDFNTMGGMYQIIWVLIVIAVIFVIIMIFKPKSNFAAVDVNKFRDKYLNQIQAISRIGLGTLDQSIKQEKAIRDLLTQLVSDEIININSIQSDLKKLKHGESSTELMKIYDQLQSSTNEILTQLGVLITNIQKTPPPPPPPPPLPPPLPPLPVPPPPPGSSSNFYTGATPDFSGLGAALRNIFGHQ